MEITALPKILSVFALAFFTFWPAIPAGLALGLSPLVVVLTTTISYVCGVALILLPGERVRNWLMQRYQQRATQANEERGVIRQIWERYGIIGLGLLGPMTVGAQIGAVLGLSLNAPPRRLFIWMAIGALVWSIVLTLAVTLGVLGAQTMIEPGIR